jgi:hypothetical protein
MTILIVLAIWIVRAVICVMKGKPWFAAIGVLVFGIFSIVGAIRLAKPTSRWAWRYDERTMAESMRRFPKEALKVERLQTLPPPVA